MFTQGLEQVEVHLLISPSCRSRLTLLKGERGALEKPGGD